jgi:polysaccharide export outer membrane protein
VVPTTILEAINSAGGFQEFANKKKVSILRGSKIIPFNYEEVIKGKKMEQNILVENGDHIIVK